MKKYMLALLMLLPQLVLFAEDGVEARPPEQGLTQMLVMIGIAIVFFYFILWRPEQKRRKTLEKQRSQMKKGDKVLAMGIIGTIAQIKDQTVILRIAEGKLEIQKACVTEVLSEEAEAPA